MVQTAAAPSPCPLGTERFRKSQGFGMGLMHDKKRGFIINYCASSPTDPLDDEEIRGRGLLSAMVGARRSVRTRAAESPKRSRVGVAVPVRPKRDGKASRNSNSGPLP